MQNDVRYCNGCLCVMCKQSKHNGNVYGCPTCRCSVCENGGGFVRRSLCNTYVPLDEGIDLADLRI